MLKASLSRQRFGGVKLFQEVSFRDAGLNTIVSVSMNTGHDSGLSHGILGLDSACGKPQLGRRFTRLAHEWASGELSYSENWFEKLSFAAACSLILAMSVPT
jgi:hypothetical protein